MVQDAEQYKAEDEEARRKVGSRTLRLMCLLGPVHSTSVRRMMRTRHARVL